MAGGYKKWLKNAPVAKKFIPIQLLTCFLLLIVSIVSIISVSTVNNSAQQIINENVQNREDLNTIIRDMYVCRVLGRDILLRVTVEESEELYDDYIAAFDELDNKMDEYAARLSDEKLDVFNDIIVEKNKYKESMIASAEIKIQGGDYFEALEALTIVTPIANAFFNSIDAFLAEEQAIMDEALAHNEASVTMVYVVSIAIDIIAIIILIVMIRAFVRAISGSLITLEKSVSEIADTGNMKIDIPNELFTQDEVGRIAVVVDDLKHRLLENSFADVLTGGLNATAYHEEINGAFLDEEPGKEIRLWCVISDMNNLKQINDNLGHIEGDAAIRACYKVLDQSFEGMGKVFRVGGDEFVSVLYGCNEEELEEKLKGISARIDTMNSRSEYRYSIAHGFGEFVGTSRAEFEEFFDTVDKKMYKNKTELKEARMNARVTTSIRDEQ